jgi:DNA helicase IV
LARARPGAPVGVLGFPTQDHADLFVAEAARELVSREPSASLAVIAASREAARRIHGLVAHSSNARLVLDGEFTFDSGIDVTHVDAVKGLEFDYVVVPDASDQNYPDGDETRHRLHVAATRAAHQLWVVWGGRASPAIAVRQCAE